MKTKEVTRKNRRTGFTLVEVGVVLAIIGILAAISIPSVSYFLRQGRVKSVVGSVNSIKNWIGTLQASGATGGAMPVTEGTRPPCLGAALLSQDANAVSAAARLDMILVSAGIADKFLSFGMGNQNTSASGSGAELEWNVRKRGFYIPDETGTASTTATATKDWSLCSRLESRLSNPALSPAAAAGANFRLNGSGGLPANTVVAYVLLKDVPFKDAIELSRSLNGEDLTQVTDAGTSDQDSGPVVFQRPAAGSSTTDVYIYVAHI